MSETKKKPTSMLYTFWCGWEVPDGVPDEHMVEAWPAGMKGWLSGSGDVFSTWVGRVDAASAEAAEKIVRGCYGKSGRRIRMRWEPEKNALGYRPGGRFPE